MATGYPYQDIPLDRERREIRVLSFDGSEASDLDVLSASFRVLSLDPDQDETQLYEGGTRCSYNAVSYTWGTSTETVPMVIDGQRVSIRRNADIALRQLLKHKNAESSSGVTMWMDAICIDQSSLTEKSQQVAMMGDVYASAEEVLIWLGEDDGLAPIVFSLIGDIVADCARATDNYTKYWDLTFPITANGRHRMISRGFWTPSITLEHIIDREDWTTETWQSLTRFYSCAWFQRLWIAQEVVLAKHARCYWGNESIDWANIALAAAWMGFGQMPRRIMFDEGIMKDGLRFINAVRHARELFHLGRGCALIPTKQDLKINNLLALTMQTNDFQCSEPRDRVYGLLGLLPKDARQAAQAHAMIEPDYSLSIATVYTEATKATMLVGGTGSATILKRAGLRSGHEGYDDDWPSWVPRYGALSHGALAHEALGATISIIDPYDTVTFYRPLEVGDMPRFTKVLKIKGFCLDTVSLVTDPFIFPDTYEGYTEAEMHTIYGKFVRTVQEAVSLAHINVMADVDWIHRALALTLCCGRTANDLDASLDETFLALFKPLLESFETFEETRIIPRRLLPFAVAIHGHSKNRPFFISKDGRIGMGPAGTKAEDRICFLSGHSWPLVLRQVDEHWVLIGDAYVYGLMDGTELQRLHESGRLDKEAQWFDVH